MPEEKLTEIMAKVSVALGSLQSIDYNKGRFTSTDGERLVIGFDVIGEDASTKASTECQSIGMKGYLTAFDMAAEIP